MRTRICLIASVAVLGALLGCSNSSSTGSPSPEPADTDVTADRCLVRLHGRTGSGAEPTVHDDHVELSPTGNGVAGDGYEWLYDSDERRDEALDRVTAWIDRVECSKVVLHGFSNGAAFAGALYCSGESFEGRLRGVVVDDPVTDEAVLNCDPPDGVPVALYWTGALTEAQPGVRCADIGYTCSGDLVIGIDAYAAALGSEMQASPHSGHDAFLDAPEIMEWLLTADS